jgi:hypothetical protein
MQTWAARELQTLDLGDARRTRRLQHLVECLVAHPQASLPDACRTWAASKAAYRLLDNAAVTPDAIRAAHVDATVARLAGHQRVLLIQDTTSLDFSHHPATQGLGPLEHPASRGLQLHSVLSVTLAGVPAGLVSQQVWARDPATVGQRHQRRQRATAEKESQRWLDGVLDCEAVLPPDLDLVTIADREADIYALFALPRRAGHDLLIRAAHDRTLAAGAERLWAAAQAGASLGEQTVTVGRRPDQPLRTATLTVRVAAVQLAPPLHHRQRASCPAIPVWSIWAEETQPPDGCAAVQWLLLTTLPVTTLAEAATGLGWYALRWLIERYHFVLKSGCRIEALQLATAARLERALATYSIVAWRLLWLTYLARQTPDAPCTLALAPAAWQALWCAHHQTTTLPDTLPTLALAVRWIARLGGFLGRTGDGAPGVTVLWRGLQRLDDLTAMFTLLHPAAQTCG